MEEAPKSLAEVLALSDSLHHSVDALRDLARVTKELDAGDPGLKVKGAHGQNIGMTLNRFVVQSETSNDSAESKKQKEATFVQHSQTAAKSVQSIMVWLKDARANVADPNKVCDKTLALGSKITNMVVSLIKVVKQVTFTTEGSAHHVLQMIPADAQKLHDNISELQRLVETWILTSRATSVSLRNKAPEDVFNTVKEMAAQTIVAVKALSDSVLNNDVQAFAKKAKEVAVLLSKLIKHAQNRQWKEIGDALLKDAQTLISSGKNAVKNKEAQTDFYEVVSTTMSNIKTLLQSCKDDSNGVTGSARASQRSDSGSDLTSTPTRGSQRVETPAMIEAIIAQMPQFKQLWDSAKEEERQSVALALKRGNLDVLRTPERMSERSPSRKSLIVSTEKVETEDDLQDVERGFKETLRDMQQWYNMLRAPFRFWAPNFDKTDYEAIIDRTSPEGKVIASMVEPIDEVAGSAFLLIVNANLCIAESSGKSDPSHLMDLVEEPAKLLFDQLLGLVQSLRLANNDKKAAAWGLVDASISECGKWLEEGETKPQLGEADQVTINAASGAFVARLVASSLKGKLYHDCNKLRVTCIHLCSVLASLQKYSSLLPHQLMQICSSIRVMCESVSELMNTVATQIMVLKKLEEEELKDTAASQSAEAQKQRKKDAADDFSDMLDTKSQQALELLNQRMEKKSKGEQKVSIWRDADDTNMIWVDKAAKKGVRAANLNKLVQELTSTVNYDTSFVQTFVATYQSFTTPDELFNKLVERYDVPSGMDAKLRQQIRLRVAIVVKHWVEHQFADFDQNIITRLYDLCKRLEADGQVPMSQALYKLIHKKDEARLAKLKSFLSVPPTDMQIPSGYVNPGELFMMYDPKDIAEQMTIIDFSWFADIEPRELLNQCWSKPKLQYRASNVLGLINRVNILSYWIPSMILWPDKLVQRVKVFEKFIMVANHLRRLGNFSGLMSVLAGLGQSSTSRLTHTKASLSVECKKIFSELESLMSPVKSFANYRAKLRSSKPPAVPYLGVYLQDLTFIEDGNPEQIDGLVNFERLGLVYGVLKEVLLFQQQTYAIPVLEPMSTLLISLPFATEKNLYDLSLMREPRGETDISKIK